MSPERLVDFLFSSGSRLAAKASLDGGTAFSTSQFRRSAIAVHAACNGIAKSIASSSAGLHHTLQALHFVGLVLVHHV